MSMTHRYEYPFWYGINEVEFIWNGAYSDAHIRYKGHIVNSTIVEDSMWKCYKDEKPDCTFEEFMYHNQEMVKELFLMAILG